MAEGKKRRKPQARFNDIDWSKLEFLASRGLSLQEIADCLGISDKSMYNYRKKHAEITEAIRIGRSKGTSVIKNSLYEKAKDGDVPAIKFYLVNVSNWMERAAHELTGKDGGPIEAEVKVDDYRERVLGKLFPRS